MTELVENQGLFIAKLVGPEAQNLERPVQAHFTCIELLEEWAKSILLSFRGGGTVQVYRITQVPVMEISLDRENNNGLIRHTKGENNVCRQV